MMKSSGQERGRSATRAAERVRRRPASAGPTASAESAVAKITPSRMAAFEILRWVGEGKGHSDELLHSARVDALSLGDRNLTTALVMGVLRWQIALDARVRQFLERPEQKLSATVAIALRMGAFQLLHLERIPAHAALSESVELCRAGGEPHAAGMVNAVLRRVASSRAASQSRAVEHAAAAKPTLLERTAGGSDRTTPLYESVAAVAERLGHPRWLVERWAAAYGRKAALAICEADQREPGEGGMFRENGGDLPQLDDGSRLVAELAAAAVPGAKQVWDCCAAPGGKTLILAWRLPETKVFASDVSARRLAQTEARLRRFAYAARIGFAVADASDAKQVQGEFDLILCDVPCSGTGTLARNPEIRHHLRIEDLTRQVERQRRILAGALTRLAPRGRLVYSNCSLEREEGEDVVDPLVDSGEWKRVPLAALLREMAEGGVLAGGAGLESAVWDDALRTLPGVHGCDGFFAAVLERS